jgi:hypothetical protein
VVVCDSDSDVRRYVAHVHEGRLLALWLCVTVTVMYEGRLCVTVTVMYEGTMYEGRLLTGQLREADLSVRCVKARQARIFCFGGCPERRG